jgi:cell division transport system permease protein
MRAKHDEILPLGRDASSRYLPWLYALIVYLAGLALAAALVLGAAAGHWQQGGLDRLTVQLLPEREVPESVRLNHALEIVRATPGVAEARVIEPEEGLALLEPWLGRDTLPADLPLPRLIDVRLTSGEAVDPQALEERLKGAIEGVSVDDPKPWLDHLAGFGRALAALSAAIIVLIGGAAGAISMLTTRMGLAVHQDVIELLHLMGARDNFVARLFQFQAFWLGLKGGALGLLFALGTLFGVRFAAPHFEAALLPDLSLAPWGWVLLAALPPAAALVAMVTARLTALRALTRLP